jgi:hypothetical protein
VGTVSVADPVCFLRSRIFSFRILHKKGEKLNNLFYAAYRYLYHEPYYLKSKKVLIVGSFIKDNRTRILKTMQENITKNFLNPKSGKSHPGSGPWDKQAPELQHWVPVPVVEW